MIGVCIVLEMQFGWLPSYFGNPPLSNPWSNTKAEKPTHSLSQTFWQPEPGHTIWFCSGWSFLDFECGVIDEKKHTQVSIFDSQFLEGGGDRCDQGRRCQLSEPEYLVLNSQSVGIINSLVLRLIFTCGSGCVFLFCSFHFPILDPWSCWQFSGQTKVLSINSSLANIMNQHSRYAGSICMDSINHRLKILRKKLYLYWTYSNFFLCLQTQCTERCWVTFILY